ncbi:serine-rich adhesin for platelets [Salvelinus alpinus]|uniref:serine-rich adhesin for platelets n=1 Tax=Salvelinus alpinus TaxID=8036 RepID=UPI0039FCA278
MPTENSHLQTVAVSTSPGTDLFHTPHERHNFTNATTAEDAIAASSTGGFVWKEDSGLPMPAEATEANLTLISNYEAGFESVKNGTVMPVAHLSKGVEKEKASELLRHSLLVNRNQRIAESITLMSTRRRLGVPMVTATRPHIIDKWAKSNDNEEKRGQDADENGILELERNKYPLSESESILRDRKEVSLTTERVMTNMCLNCLQEKRPSSTEKMAVLSALFDRGSSLSLGGNGNMLTVNSSHHKASMPSSFEVTTEKQEDKTVVFDGAKTSKKSTFDFSVNLLDGLDYEFVPPLSSLNSEMNLSKIMLNDSFASTSFSNSGTIEVEANTTRTVLLTTKVENMTVSRLSDISKSFDKRLLSTTTMPYPLTSEIFHTLLLSLRDKEEKISGKTVNLRNQSKLVSQIQHNSSVKQPTISSSLLHSFLGNHTLAGVDITSKDTEFSLEDGGGEERKHAVGQVLTIPLTNAPSPSVHVLSDQNMANDPNNGSIISGVLDSLNSLFSQAREIITSKSHITDHIDESALPMRMPSIESQSATTSFRSTRQTTAAVKVPPASQALTESVKSLMSVLSTTGHLPAQPSVLFKEQQPMSLLPEVSNMQRASVTMMRTLSRKPYSKSADNVNGIDKQTAPPVVLSQTVKPSAKVNAQLPRTTEKGVTFSTKRISETTSKLDIYVSAMMTTTTTHVGVKRSTEQRLAVGRGDIKSSGDTFRIFADSAGNLETPKELKNGNILKLKNNKGQESDFSQPQGSLEEVTEMTMDKSSTVHHGIMKTTERLAREEKRTSANMPLSHLLIKLLGATARDIHRAENLSESLEEENKSFSSQAPSHKMPVETVITPSQTLSRIVSFNKKPHIVSKPQQFSTHRVTLTKCANASTKHKQSNQQRHSTKGKKQVFMTTFSRSTVPGPPNQIRNVNGTFNVSPEIVKSTFSTLNSVGNLYSLTAAKSLITVEQSTIQPNIAIKTSTSHTSIIQHVSARKHHISISTLTTSGNSVSQSITVGDHLQRVGPATTLFDIVKEDIVTSDITEVLKGSHLVPLLLPRPYNDTSTSPPTDDYSPTGPLTASLALHHRQGQSSSEIMPFDAPSQSQWDSFTDSEEKEERHSNASHASADNEQISPSEAPIVHEVKSEQSGFSTWPAPFAADSSAGTSHINLTQSRPDETMGLRAEEPTLPSALLNQTTNGVGKDHALSRVSPAHESGRKLLGSGRGSDPLALHQRIGLSSPDLLTGLAVISDDICGTGNYTAEMNLNLERDVLPGDFVPALGILHVVINLKTNNSQVNLEIKSCCLSPTVQLDEINTTCCVFSRLPLSPQGIRLLPSILSKRASFTISLFQMINYSMAYLHCDLSICLRNHTECERVRLGC